MSVPPELAGPLVILVLGMAFDVLCLVDLARAYAVRSLDKTAWAVLICVSTPIGGMAYLLFGRAP